MWNTEIPLRKVLVIAYYFPPMGLSGVQRTLKFVKYMTKFGWHPTVLTVAPVGYFALDESLLDEVRAPGIRIERTETAGPGKLFAKREVVKLPTERYRKLLSRVSDALFIPDNKIGWRRKAVARAMELNKEEQFDLVFTTAPPFTDFLIGADVKARINKPLVFDYRDPWLDYPFKFYPTPLHRWRNYQLERRALRASSHVIATNRRVKEALIARYPFLTYHDVDIISQGYDPEDFNRNGLRRRDGKMKITYAGVFWEDRVPDHFLRALHDLLEERPNLRNRVEACFVGNFRDENIKTVEDLGLRDVVNILGYLPHKECVRHLLESDVLWMIVGDEFGSPGKTYEYIGAGKPILGCVPDGFLKATILEAGGKVVAPADVGGIKAAIEEYFALYERHALKGPRPDVVEKYSRVNLTGQLVKIFESLIEQ